MNDLRILVAGDPIKDTYYVGTYDPGKKRFHVERVDTCGGGALNVYNNLQHLLGTLYPEVRCYNSWFNNIEATRYYELIRYITFNHNFYLEVPSFTNRGTEPIKSFYSQDTAFNREFGLVFDGLVLSDYNKGALQSLAPVPSENDSHWPIQKEPFKFIVVDSRYGSIHPSWLSLFTNCRILHATVM